VKADQGFIFNVASGHKSELEAVKLARASGEKIQQETGGVLMFLCAPRWNNQGQPIAFGSDGMNDDPPAEKSESVIGNAIGSAKDVIRQTVTKDYRRDCVPPADAARAELMPTKSGVAQVKNERPPAKTWKPADWCPSATDGSSTGIRN
jgi:hypothetical protein